MLISVHSHEEQWSQSQAIVKAYSGIPKGKGLWTLWGSLGLIIICLPLPHCLETLPHSQELLQTAALSENMLLLFTFSYFLLLSKEVLEKGAGIWSMVLFCTSFISVKVDIDFDTPKKWQTTTSVGERGQGKQSPCTLFCTHNRYCHYVNCTEVLKSKSRTFKCPRNVT